MTYRPGWGRFGREICERAGDEQLGVLMGVVVCEPGSIDRAVSR
jgi:hypothetical protein